MDDAAVIKNTAWLKNTFTMEDVDPFTLKAVEIKLTNYVGLEYFTMECDGDGLFGTLLCGAAGGETGKVDYGSMDKGLTKYTMIIGAVFGGLKVRPQSRRHDREPQTRLSRALSR